jgi:hypothetical protein
MFLILLYIFKQIKDFLHRFSQGPPVSNFTTIHPLGAKLIYANGWVGGWVDGWMDKCQMNDWMDRQT